MKKIISYDTENDIFVIHKGFAKDEKFKGNIDAGELILDVSTKGKIKGIEIMNAINFLKEFEIDKNILSSIEDADFNALLQPSGISLGITIKAKNIEHQIPAKITVPIDAPNCY